MPSVKGSFVDVTSHNNRLGVRSFRLRHGRPIVYAPNFHDVSRHHPPHQTTAASADRLFLKGADCTAARPFPECNAQPQRLGSAWEIATVRLPPRPLDGCGPAHPIHPSIHPSIHRPPGQRDISCHRGERSGMRPIAEGMPDLRLEVLVQDMLSSLPLWKWLPWLFAFASTILLLRLHQRRRRTYRRLVACGLPTVYWRPRFATYNPTSVTEAGAKLPPTGITNVLPRMRRLGGPYGMYGTVYGLDTPVIHIAHPVPARAVLTAVAAPAPPGKAGASPRTAAAPPPYTPASGAAKAPAYDHFKNFCGEGVFTADGTDWRRKRAAVTHALLRVEGGYEAAVEREANAAVQRLQWDLDRARGRRVNVVPLLQRATIGLIYRYITHTDLDTGLPSHSDRQRDATQPSSKGMEVDEADSPPSTSPPGGILRRYLDSITQIRMIILAQSRSVWFLLPRWCYQSLSSMYRDEEKLMHPIRVFSHRACLEALPGSPLATLQQQTPYCWATLDSSKVSKNLLDEAITLLFAGQDTSAATLSWTLHLLSLYPAVQNKLADEVHSVINTINSDGFLSKKLISRMTYLDAVIKESMRLYPVAPFVVRKLPSNLTLLDEKGSAMALPQDSFACIWIYGIHRNPKFWKNPDDFIPERWLFNNDKEGDIAQNEGISNGAYMPFAVGPRNCVGQPLAHIILRILLARLILRYEFRDDRLVAGGDPNELRKDMQAGFTVLPQDGVDLAIRKRCYL